MVVLDNTKAETTLATSEDARRLRLSIDVMSDALNSLALESSKATNAQIDDVYRLLGAAQSFLAQSTLASKRLDEYLELERAQNKTSSEEKQDIVLVKDDVCKKPNRSKYRMLFPMLLVIMLEYVVLAVSKIAFPSLFSTPHGKIAFVCCEFALIAQLCVLYGLFLPSFWNIMKRTIKRQVHESRVN